MCSSLISACGGDKPDTLVVDENGNTNENGNGGNGNNGKQGGAHPIPQELATIPEAYYQAANQPGTLLEFTYETYESRTYEQKSRKLTKRAIVYLPYGYSGENKYNVYYLMHGGWGNETSPLGTPGRPNALKHVIDNSIANGEMQPLIIVCPTYNNTSPEDSGNFGLALELNRNYHNELLNDLIPAVEGAYSSYAQTTSPEDLMAARDHRGFGGFSMGSVATWRTFQYGLDYFRYFLPMSCGTSLDEDNIFVAAQNHDPDDYFVWVITGTADFAYSYDENRVQKMRNSPYFTESDSEQNGNFAYRVKDGYGHDGRASMEYTYNGLLWFWGEDKGNNDSMGAHLTTANYVRDIVNHPAFEGFGDLLLARDNNASYYDTPLSEVGSLMPYHGNVRPDVVVGALNHLIDEANSGKTIFYDLYTAEQKQQAPPKRYTGLFFYRGQPDAPFAVVCPGGGFSYVGSLHEGFPLAQRISELGLNAFVLRYRIGSEQQATEDLAAAIAYIFSHAGTLGVSTKDYSVWGGSAGARMAGNIALSGVAAYGGGDLPKPATAVIAYTGQTTYSADFSPAFITVAANDGIANVNTVERRVANLLNAGVEVEYRRYQTAGHGFGLGTGTDAEGWLDLAVRFWQQHINE
jgi:acetyl esterase/lipase/enterochelin esterase-like enzyme